MEAEMVPCMRRSLPAALIAVLLLPALVLLLPALFMGSLKSNCVTLPVTLL